MPGITTTILAGGAAAMSIGKGISDISKGKKMEREARRKREEYQMPELSNIYAGLAIPTSSARMQQESAMQTQADLSYMVGQAGAQAAIGAAPGLAESTRRSIESIGAQLEQSEFRLRQMIAEDEARIRNIREQRAQADLQGLGVQEAYGQSLQSAGAGRIVSTFASGAELASAFAGGRADDTTKSRDRAIGAPATTPTGTGIGGFQQSLNFPDQQEVYDPQGNLTFGRPDLSYKSPVQPWQERVGLNYNFNPII